MLFKILDKEGFRSLVAMLLESNEVIGPRRVGHGADGEPIHQLLPVERFDQLDLGYVMLLLLLRPRQVLEPELQRTHRYKSNNPS